MTGARQAQLRYDPFGRLHQVTGPAGTTRFVHDGDDLVMEMDGAGFLRRRYVHGTDAGDNPIAWPDDLDWGGTMEAANERFLRTDERGSVVAVASAGNILALNRYDEYGIPAASNLGRFQYTGQAWLPELGMYHYKARLYSPTLGRFLQTDPIGYADGMNIYAYVGNDPINGVDPTGTIFKLLPVLFSGLFSGGGTAVVVTATKVKAATITAGQALAVGTAAAGGVAAPLAISASPQVSALFNIGRCPTDGSVSGNLGDPMITITAGKAKSGPEFFSLVFSASLGCVTSPTTFLGKVAVAADRVADGAGYAASGAAILAAVSAPTVAGGASFCSMAVGFGLLSFAASGVSTTAKWFNGNQVGAVKTAATAIVGSLAPPGLEGALKLRSGAEKLMAEGAGHAFSFMASETFCPEITK